MSRRGYKTILWCRIILSLIVLVAVSLSFVLGDGWLGALGSTLNDMQLVPLGLTFALGWLLLWAVATILLGRIYCSSICPLGTLQDVAAALLRVNPGRKAYHYTQPLNTVRYWAFLAVLMCVLIGWYFLPEILDPYTAFNRMAQCLGAPAWNFLGSHLGFGTARTVMALGFGAVIALVSLVVLAAMVLASGRIFCNTLCPVGAALSLLSIKPVWHMDIDTDRCTNCRRCEYVCKAQCINLTDHVVDTSRCLVCFNCTAACHDGAMRYTTRRHRLSTPLMQPLKGILPSPRGTVATDCSKNLVKKSHK